jgi:hypothetical protein
MRIKVCGRRSSQQSLVQSAGSLLNLPPIANSPMGVLQWFPQVYKTAHAMGAAVVVVDHESTAPIILQLDHFGGAGSLILVAPASAKEGAPEIRDHPAWQHRELSAASAHARPYIQCVAVHTAAIAAQSVSTHPRAPSGLCGVYGINCYEVQVGVDQGSSLQKRLFANDDGLLECIR